MTEDTASTGAPDHRKKAHDAFGDLVDPAEIYQDFLDAASVELMHGDVASFSERISLPFLMRLVDQETVLETREELQADSKLCSDALKLNGVTHYVRLVQAAHYLSDTVIEGWHVTYLMRNAVTITPPYKNRLLFRKLKGKWLVMEAEHEFRTDKFPVTRIQSDPGALEARWNNPRLDIRALHTNALPLYQSFLSGVDAAARDDDFELWKTHFAFPHVLHLQNHDHEIKTPQDLKKSVFDHQKRTGPNGETILVERTAIKAEFIGDHRIVGYHTARWQHEGTPVGDTVHSRMILDYSQDAFRCIDITNSLKDDLITSGEFVNVNTIPTLREIEQRMKK